MQTYPMPQHRDLSNPEYNSWKKFLTFTEHWTHTQIKAYQLASLKRIVHLAYTKTPGYQKLYDSHRVSPDDIQNLHDIEKLPFITKEDIRDNLERFTVKEADSEYVTTGGSTAIPFGFYRTKKAFARELASKAHQYSRIGWNEHQRQIVFRGLPIKTKDHMEYVPDLHELRCSTYYMDRQSLDTYYQAATQFKPEVLRCYPSAGATFAQYLQETKQRIPTIKIVLCASELLYPWQQQLLSKTFDQAKVFSHYGHYELCVLAGYCEHQSAYHVLPQYGLAEVINKNNEPVTKPGETGEIVGTSFIMDSTIFIRYKTQDRAVFASNSCKSCGRPYQVWESIDGRLQEFIVTNTDRKISMTALNMHDSTFDGIKQFQIEQRIPGTIEIKYIATQNIDTIQLTKKLQAKLGTDFLIEYKKVNSIKPTKRGKHTFLVQHLPI